MAWLTKRETQTAQAARSGRQGWFGRLAGILRRPRLDEGVWEEMEEALLGADVGYDLTLELLDHLRRRAQDQGLADGHALQAALQEELLSILQPESSQGSPSLEPNFMGSPHVVLVIGVNGSGKTTSIAKLARLYQEEGKSVLLAAADTFRAAAIDQLQHWAQRLDVEMVAHKPGANPGAVVYDALLAARSRGREVVLVDTAGRLHTKANLMEELRAVHRVVGRALPGVSPEVLLVLDATTGQNGLTQAREFTRAVQVHSVLLAKLDGTAKGGVVFAIRRQLGIPVAFIGTGEGLEDLAPFDSAAFVADLFSQP